MYLGINLLLTTGDKNNLPKRKALVHSSFLLWLVSIAEEVSLPEMTSDASKLASMLYFSS